MYEQVHILHRDRAQQHLIAEYQRTGEAFAYQKRIAHWADKRHQMHA